MTYSIAYGNILSTVGLCAFTYGQYQISSDFNTVICRIGKIASLAIFQATSAVFFSQILGSASSDLPKRAIVVIPFAVVLAVIDHLSFIRDPRFMNRPILMGLTGFLLGYYKAYQSSEKVIPLALAISGLFIATFASLMQKPPRSNLIPRSILHFLAGSEVERALVLEVSR